MASPASSRNLGQLSLQVRRSLTAGTALVLADVLALAKSWVVRLWLLVLLISFLAVPVAMLVGNGPGSTPASAALAAYLAVFLNVWSIVIIVLSAGSVSLESEIVADSILSRACTRTQYILAKLTSRALVVGGVYLLGASAAAYVSWRYGAADVTFGTMVSGIAIVGLALLMLVSLGVTTSAVFNNTIISIIGLLLLWHVAGVLFAFAGVEYMSPTSLTGRLPEILRDSRAPQVVSCSATRTSVSIIFSKDLDPNSAEQLDNYTVEDPTGTRHVPQTAVYDSATATVRLSGLRPEVSEAVTVTVDGVTDSAGNEVSPGANEATSRPPPAASEDEPQATPVHEVSPGSSAESPGPNRDEEGVTPTPEPTADEAPPGPVPVEGEDQPEAEPVDELPLPSPEGGPDANRDEEGVTPTPESAADEAIPGPVPAEGEDEPEAGPVEVSPPPSPEGSPDANRDEEGVTPTPEAAAAEPDRSSGGPADRPPRVTQVKATRATVSVTFSRDMDPVEAEELGSYTVESPPGTPRLPKTAAYDPSEKTALLSGLSLAPGDPVKVTVENMTSRGGAKIDPRRNSATFSEVQDWKYLVGFGVPALLFALVGVVWFSRRDL